VTVVLIPMFNHAEMTSKCIAEVQKNASTEDYRVLVVDDYSTSPYTCDAATVIRTPKNLGFTGAVNYGLRHLRLQYDHVILLNNDTEPYPDFIKNMVQTAEKDKSIGIVGAGRVISKEPYQIITWGADLLTGKSFGDDKDYEEPSQCIFIPFCCVLLTRECVETVGLLDERMRNHCSDNDYCLRTLMMNKAVVYEPSAKVYHHHSVTIKHEKIYPDADQKIFVMKWFGVAMNEILERIPINYDLGKHGRIQFIYEEKKRPILQCA